MSRIPMRHRGSERDGQYVRRINSMYCSIDNYTKILLESMLYDLRHALLARIIEAGKTARLDACDDKIYDAYIRLMEYYRKAVDSYDESADVLVSPKLKSTIEGIYSILKSRLALESPSRFIGEDENFYSENPIFEEKKSIIRDGMAAFTDGCCKFATAFKRERLWECQQQTRKLFIAADTDIDYDAKGLELAGILVACQREHIYGEAYALYVEIVKACMQKLNDIESRAAILQYNERLEQEQEILGSIVKIQLPLAEKEKACSPTEESVAKAIVKCVRDGYDALVASMSEINAGVRDSRKAQPVADETENVMARICDEDSLRTLLTATNYQGFAASIKLELAEVLRALETEVGITAEREGFGRKYLRCMYDIQRSLSCHREMAAEMTAVFERILVLGREKAVGLEQSNELLIIQGINETIEIKIESLLENRDQFEQETSQILERTKADKPDIRLKDLNGLSPNVDPALKESVFASYRQKMEKHISALQDSIGKKTMGFKKDCLLFELTTFEEIITYSVSRIEASTIDNIAAYVSGIQEAWNELEAILLKNSIVAIKPQAHDMFNGKEHEVLMAEKHPEYKKGEIIKLMNCGYRQDDIVLIRANVVAAM